MTVKVGKEKVRAEIVRADDEEVASDLSKLRKHASIVDDYHLPAAKPAFRVLASVLDAGFMGIFLTIDFWFFNPFEKPFSFFTFLVIIFFFYNCIPLHFWGQTLGKKLTKIKVINFKDGQYLSIKQTMKREFIGKAISLVFLLGYIMILIKKDHRGWHDQIASTNVITLIPRLG